MSEDLIEEMIVFVRQQLNEDERAALATSPVGDRVWHVANSTGLAQGSWLILQPHHGAQSLGSHGVEHIARHDPARVLREVEAFRKILDEIVPMMNGMDEKIDEEWNPGEPVSYSSLILLRLLAAIFSDRPGYREEWRALD